VVLALFLCADCAHAPTAAPRDPDYTACAGGQLDACRRHAEGLGEADAAGALVVLQYACLLGHAPSCDDLSKVYGSAGADVAPSRQLAQLRDACDGGGAHACVLLAERVGKRFAEPLLKKACDAGDALGCHRLAATMRARFQLTGNLKRSVELEEKACELGNGAACAQAGRAYLFGAGVARDEARGNELLDDSCNAKHTGGCTLAAKIYQEGIGVKQDLRRAGRYYDYAAKKTAKQPPKKAAYVVFVGACSRHDLLGCFDAGWFRAEGVEVERNVTISREFFQRACKGGIEAACGRWKTIEPGAP